jgi:hypothetical protein
MKINCFDNTDGPAPTGNCFQFLSADLDDLVENPQNWNVNNLRFYILSAQNSYGTCWISWNHGSVTKMDGRLGRGF